MQKKIAIILTTLLIAGSTSAYGYVVGLYTDSSGNVGIGTTSPSQKLNVVGPGGATVLINSTTNTGPSLTLGSGLSSGIPIKLRSTGSGDSEGSKLFAITNSSNGVNFLLINSTTGNIGIGNKRFTETLNVNGTLGLNSLVGELVLRSQYYNNNASYITYGTDSIGRCCNKLMLLQTPSDGGIAFSSGVTNNMIISSTGNVGIGTGSPKNKLDVNGGLAVGSYAGVNFAPSNGAIISGNVGIGTTTPQNKLDINGNLDVLNGKVGIGMSNPFMKLNIVGNDSGLTPSYLRIANIGAANGGGAALEFGETYGNPDSSSLNPVARIVGTGVNPSPLQGVLSFQTYRDYSGLQTAMTIYPNGNVGINTTNPQNSLDVNGNIDVKKGANPVYRCTTAGALPVGALTTNSASCGATIDTGLRVP